MLLSDLLSLQGFDLLQHEGTLLEISWSAVRKSEKKNNYGNRNHRYILPDLVDNLIIDPDTKLIQTFKLLWVFEYSNDSKVKLMRLITMFLLLHSLRLAILERIMGSALMCRQHRRWTQTIPYNMYVNVYVCILYIYTNIDNISMYICSYISILQITR